MRGEAFGLTPPSTTITLAELAADSGQSLEDTAEAMRQMERLGLLRVDRPFDPKDPWTPHNITALT